MYKSCAFTGHRELDEDFSRSKLEDAVLKLIEEGVDTFYCGMARGFDMEAAECVLRLKKTYDIKLVACIPCAGQSKYFGGALEKRYKNILSLCDEEILLSENYYDGCMFYRDRYMVERCDVVLCYFKKKKGGTYYTVNYAKNSDKKIINIV